MSRRLATIARLRARMLGHLTDACDLEVQVMTRGSTGAPLNEWQVVSSGVACRVIRAGTRTTGSQKAMAGRESLVDGLRIVLPHGTVVGADYRIRMADGQLYEVVDVVDDLTDKTFVSVIVKRLRDSDG